MPGFSARSLVVMRLPVVLFLVAWIIGPAIAAENESATILAKQRQAADANCKTIQTPTVARSESTNFLVFGAMPETRVKALAASLEKNYAAAFKALQFEKDARPWNGKLAVYVLPDRGQFRSFVRQVEKRSPDEAEQGSAKARGDTPHIVVGPGQGKDAATPDMQAGYEVAAAMLSARARGTTLPEWLVQGFSRATAAHAANAAPSVRKRVGRQLAGRLKAAEAWNDTLSIDQRLPLATSVADFLFYGKGVAKPGDFLIAFRPDDEKPTKTAVDALEAVNLNPEQFEVGYLKWLRANN
jgi:hypothetical protein